MKTIYVVMKIETEDSPAYTVNAFESEQDAIKDYPDTSQYEIKAINLNPKQDG